MKVVVTGDRNWTDYETIYWALGALFQGPVTVLHGDQRGADTLAKEAAWALGFETPVPYPAEWKKYGKAAGPIRNRQMLDTHPDYVLAFHDDLEHSKGTKDCVNQARKLGIPVIALTTKSCLRMLNNLPVTV